MLGSDGSISDRLIYLLSDGEQGLLLPSSSDAVNMEQAWFSRLVEQDELNAARYAKAGV